MSQSTNTLIKVSQLTTEGKLSPEELKELSTKFQSMIVIETINTLVREDLNIILNEETGEKKLEKLLQLASTLGFSSTGVTLEELTQNLKTEIDSTIDNIINPNTSEIYFQFFNSKMPTFNIVDFQYLSAVIPSENSQDIVSENVAIETLGTGEYQKDEEGKEIPHDLDFVKTVLLEMIHFWSHTTTVNEKLIYDPASKANIAENWYENDTILAVTQLAEGNEWDYS